MPQDERRGAAGYATVGFGIKLPGIDLDCADPYVVGAAPARTARDDVVAPGLTTEGLKTGAAYAVVGRGGDGRPRFGRRLERLME